MDCPGPIPDDVPTGWVKVPVAACWYDLYGPPDASLLPKGLKWQECSDLGPSTYTCRELVVDWQDEAGTPVGGIPYATVLPNGEVLLQVRKLLTRFLGGMKQAAAFDLIVEADGPVRQAFYSSWNSYQYPAFVLIRTGISATTTGWQILQNQVGKTVGNLVLGGKNDALTLPVLHAFNEGDLSSGALRPGSAFYALSGSHLDVYRWDGSNLQLAKRIATGKTPSHLWIDSKSTIAYSSMQDSDELVVIDLATQTILHRIKVGSLPADIYVTPDDRTLFLGLTGGEGVEVYDVSGVRTGQAPRFLKLLPTGKGAHAFRPMGDGEHIFVSNRVANTISRIDTRTQSVDFTMPTSAGPDCMDLSADGKTLLVSSRWARKLTLIDLATRKIVREIPVGASPHGVWTLDHAPRR